MVKPDVKRNYYADLELPADASIDDVKKAYRKLALKYHPDRNPGKEDEFSPKFQAIQAAQEVLSDVNTKARYDAERKKAGLDRGAFPKPNVPPRGGVNPMYQATSAYPPPPRRTANPTASWRSTTSGADRFANFPKPAPTAKKDTTDRANVFNAWQNMKPQPTGSPQRESQRPRPPPPNPPPRRDTRYPTEEDIRAGMNYRQPPPSGYAGFRSAWAEYNAASPANKSGPSPNLGRSNTAKTPRKGGFDPTSTGDEGQASSTANYSSFRRKSADQPYFPPPPPPRSRSQHEDSDPPYTEGSRVKTPYSSHIGQQTYSSGDDVNRTAGAPQADAAPQTNARPRASARRTGTGTARKPFVVSDSSADSETEDDSTGTPPGAAQPNGQPRPMTRPKRTPNPPSRQFKNGAPFKAPADPNVGADAANDVSAKDKPSMYGNPFSSPSYSPPSAPHHQKKPSPTWPFGPGYQENKHPNRIPSWAYPSTVRPSAKRSLSGAQRAWQDYAATLFADSLRKSQPSPHNPQTSSGHNNTQKSGPDLIDLTGDDTSPPPHQPHKKPCFTKEDAAGLYLLFARPWSQFGADVFLNSFSMPIDADTFRPNMAKTRSEDNINTAFAPSEWAGAFTSNNVFAAAQPTGRKSATPSRKSSRAFRPQPTVNGSQDATQQPHSTDAIPQSTTASPPPQPVKYSAEEWQKTFKDPSWAFDPEALRSSSPGKADSRTASRSNSSARMGSRVANKIPVNAPKPATVADQEEEDAAQVSPEADAMDVDTTPPAATAPPPPPIQEPRVYPVNTTQLRQSDGGVSQPERAAPSRRESAGGAAFQTKLDDLANVAPFAPAATTEGLEGLNDIGSNLPFPSKASNTNPVKPFTPQILQLPPLPRSPEAPTKLTKASWSEYCHSFASYLDKFDKFNNTLLDHFSTRQTKAAALVKKGVSALEAVGEGSVGMGFPSYAQGVKEDERVREHWNIGCEKHAEAVKAFEAVRIRVRELSEGAGLS